MGLCWGRMCMALNVCGASPTWNDGSGSVGEPGDTKYIARKYYYLMQHASYWSDVLYYDSFMHFCQLQAFEGSSNWRMGVNGRLLQGNSPQKRSVLNDFLGDLCCKSSSRTHASHRNYTTLFQLVSVYIMSRNGVWIADKQQVHMQKQIWLCASFINRRT